MASLKTADLKKHVVKSVEGKPLGGEFVVSSLINGNDMTMMKMHLEIGDRTPFHKHGHESLIYVVEGKLKTNVGQETHIIGRGDAALHPRNVEHCVEALERTTVIEIKSCRWEEAQAIWSLRPLHAYRLHDSAGKMDIIKSKKGFFSSIIFLSKQYLRASILLLIRLLIWIFSGPKSIGSLMARSFASSSKKDEK